MKRNLGIFAGICVVAALCAAAFGFFSDRNWIFLSAGGAALVGLAYAILTGVTLKKAHRDAGIDKAPGQGDSVGRDRAEPMPLPDLGDGLNEPLDSPVLTDDRFAAQITVTSIDEGGRDTWAGGWAEAEFHFDDTSVHGQLILPQGSTGIAAGDTMQVGVSLDHSVAVTIGEKFAIRQSGRTIGYGEITLTDLHAGPPEESAPPELDIDYPEPMPAGAAPEEESGFAGAEPDETLPDAAPPEPGSGLPAALPPETVPPESAPPVMPSPTRGPAKMAPPPEPEAALPGRDEDTIGFYFATCRKPARDGTGWFGAERADANIYGVAAVHVPPERKFGSLKRPFKLSVFSLVLYEQKENPAKHFIVEKVETVPLDAWKQSVSAHDRSDALIFIHGFNNSFEEAVFRAGQIFWDLGYDGVPVLFSWASGGKVADYLYDQNSALQAGTHFRKLLAELADAGVSQIKILAHSMGNYMLVNALHGYLDELGTTSIGEVMMAAPDVDRDLFLDKIPALRAAIPGLTLYASAHDRALLASMKIAGGIPRAGFVTADGPIIAEGVDSIDVSEIGEEMFGLGHGAFAERPSVLNDIALLLNSGTRPPGKRLAQLRGMPLQDQPKWWRFQA